MVEYANEAVIRLLKQYDMLARSLKLIGDASQKNDIYDQMTLIIKHVIGITNSIYEKKYKQVATQSVYLMDDERRRLSELIHLIQERRVYVNNQISSNRELTGISFDVPNILGEEKLDEYKSNVKLIDRYKSNVQLEIQLNEELKTLDVTIDRANHKISSNKNLNRQLEDKMIRVVGSAINSLSLYELKEREKEIDLAYTELGYSLEKAKENAIIARRNCSEDIVLECESILAATTSDYEKYKEKKLELQIMDIYKNPVSDYDSLLSKREEMNNILFNISNSELYSLIGEELNKQYSTIKLEAQDTLKLEELTQEKELKQQKLREIDEENNSDLVKGILSTLLENEKKHQIALEEERRKQEEERKRQEEIEKKKRLEEKIKMQKALDEERKKEIEQRTKQLLDEKKKPVLQENKEEKHKSDNIIKKEDTNKKREEKKKEVDRTKYYNKDDFFSKKLDNSRVDKGIPVVKNNKVVDANKDVNNDYKLFPDIPFEKKSDIFPGISDKDSQNSFFDENEFSDLSNYMDDKNNKNWF